MRKRLLLSVLAAIGALALAPAGSSPALPDRFDPQRDAAADLRQALALAGEEGKKVLVDVGGEWCAWCHIFDRFVAARPQVQKVLQDRYVLLKVNYSPQNRNEQLLSRWPKATGYPHFHVLDAAGAWVASQPSGQLEAGRDYDEAKVLAFLRRHS